MREFIDNFHLKRKREREFYSEQQQPVVNGKLLYIPRERERERDDDDTLCVNFNVYNIQQSHYLLFLFMYNKTYTSYTMLHSFLLTM